MAIVAQLAEIGSPITGFEVDGIELEQRRVVNLGATLPRTERPPAAPRRATRARREPDVPGHGTPAAALATETPLSSGETRLNHVANPVRPRMVIPVDHAI